MCGIAGALFLEGAHRDPADVVRRMTDALAHRGPDGQGMTRCAGADRENGPVVMFGHRRLAIIDLTDRAAQPMMNAAGTCWITFNGEIYNYRELRSELESLGRVFSSASDTETILQAYDTWGERGLDRLRGMFAFAIWDASRRRLLLVRDRLGIKPLYVARAGAALLFASEVRAILASDLVPRRLDATALWQYVGYQTVPVPRTLIEGIRLIEPGSALSVDEAGRSTPRRYWDLLASASPASQEPAPQVIRKVRGLLEESISLHLVSDVPVGVFLSGGIDSSAIVALVRSAGRTPVTFSVGFRDQGFDESPYAKVVADRFAAEHTHIELEESALLDALPQALDAMDHPSGDGVNSYIVSGAVRHAGLKVALSGLGGDELFGGYPSFSRMARARLPLSGWGATPRAVRGAAASLVRAFGSSVATAKVASVLETDGSLSAAWPITRQLLSQTERQRLIAPRWLERAEQADPYAERLAQAFRDAPDAELWAKVSYAEARTYMHDVLLRDTDQMSMAHGLEVRVPLLDHRLAECVMGLSDACKRLDGGPKPLLVRALGGELPDAIVRRPKQGFTLPFDPWMRSALREFCGARLGPAGLEGRGLFRRGAPVELWNRFLARDRGITWSRVWTLVALESWLDRHGVGEPA